MTPSPDLREVFSKALETPQAGRIALLSELSPSVRAEIESLLEAHEVANEFLETPDTIGSRVGERFGPYLLLEKIGEGGMGVVYRARRDDGEFQCEVAIKLVGGWLFTPEAERRFIEERRILALLDHPNIIRMIDGGVAHRTRYLAMELASGKTVIEHCIHLNLPVTDRLRLFQSICSAIQYAHQRFILHRDLKPGNILVSPDGKVKVLDFGIARLLTDSGMASAFTTALHPLTLSCASPEQVSGAPLTLASDVYALGLLLYELLTDSNPQSVGTRTEIMRRIVENDLEPPSKRTARVSADLDAIVLKALSKDPERRYPSAEAMSADVERYLHKRPVLARPPSRVYALTRFSARNKPVVALACALIVAVFAGLAVSGWHARQADRQRMIAERRFDEARHLLHTVIQEIQPQLAAVNGTVAIRQSLVEKSLVYLEALSKDASDNAALTRELIDSYLQLASVTGNPGGPNTGDRKRASEMLRKAEALVNVLNRIKPPDAPTQLTLGHFYAAAARDAFNYGSKESARGYAQRSLDIAEYRMKSEPGQMNSSDELASALNLLASVSSPKERIPLFERSLVIWQELYRNQPSDRLLRNVALMHKNLAGTWSNLDDYQRSLDHARQALVIDESRLAGEPTSPVLMMDLAFDAGSLGWSYYRLRDYARAGWHMRRNVLLRERVVAANPDDRRAADRLAYALRDLAGAENAIGASPAARRYLMRTLGIYTRLEKDAPLNRQSLFRFAATSHDLGKIEQKSGRKNEACRYLLKAASILGDFKDWREDADDTSAEMIEADAFSCRPAAVSPSGSSQ